MFLDCLGLDWQYEPEGFDLGSGIRYLPDFRVVYPDRGQPEIVWFEVKPTLSLLSAKEIEKIGLFDDRETLIVLDGPPDAKMYLRGGEIRALDADSHFRDGLALWSNKERPWWDTWRAFFGPDGDAEAAGAIQRACLYAKQARFDGRAA